MRRSPSSLLVLAASAAVLAGACTGGGDGAVALPAEPGGRPEPGVAVGVAFDVGGRGDGAFNDGVALGLERTVDEFGVDPPRELEPDRGGGNRRHLVRLLAEDGADLVVAVGARFAEPVRAAAAAFPDTTFALVDGTVDAGNVASLVFAEEQASYLVGAAAALSSATGRIGVVGGPGPEAAAPLEAGWLAGARAARPEVVVDVRYLGDGSTSAVSTAEEVAAELFASGADVVFAAVPDALAGVAGAASAASADGVHRWAVGSGHDHFPLVHEALRAHVLTSSVKHVDVAVYETVKALLGGDAGAGEVTVFDLATDGVGYATSGDHLAPAVVERLEDLKQRIVDGKVEVPAGPAR